MYTVGHTRIMGIGTFVPDQIVTSRELLQQIGSKERFGIPLDWLDRTTGIATRYVAPVGMPPSHMATRAAIEALDRGRVLAAEIDVIVYAGVNRDYIEPATAHIVQHNVGAANAIVFDVTNACHGFMNGLHLVDALIATGQARRGLVVTGEQGSRAMRRAVELLSKTTDREKFINLAGGLTVGDAGAAVVLGPKRSPESGFVGFMLASRGEHSQLCVCHFEGEADEEVALRTDMPNIVKHHVRMHAEMFDGFMMKLGWEAAQIQRFVHHQVGLRVFKLHSAYSGIPTDRMTNTVATHGNLISASIPLNLRKIQDKQDINSGDRVFISGSGSGLSVSQAGLVWEAA